MKSFNSSETKYSNNRIVIMLVTVVFLMLGLAYASVPLYDLFCRVTGFGGTPAVSLEKSEYSINQNINIRLDANVTNLNWDFSPEKNVYKIKIGMYILAVAYLGIPNGLNAKSIHPIIRMVEILCLL